MKSALITLMIPVMLALGLFLFIGHVAGQRQAIIDRVETEVRAQGCTSADQSYYTPNIFYLRCPDGIREYDINQ